MMSENRRAVSLFVGGTMILSSLLGLTPHTGATVLLLILGVVLLVVGLGFDQ